MVNIYFIAFINSNVLHYLWSFHICYKVINNWFVSSCFPSKLMNFFVLKNVFIIFRLLMVKIYQFSTANSKSILFLETLPKTAHQSPLYQRLRLCSLEAICPISGLCVSVSSKGSETNKERSVNPESMWQFLQTNF
jgi:hypothetical protein